MGSQNWNFKISSEDAQTKVFFQSCWGDGYYRVKRIFTESTSKKTNYFKDTWWLPGNKYFRKTSEEQYKLFRFSNQQNTAMFELIFRDNSNHVKPSEKNWVLVVSYLLYNVIDGEHSAVVLDALLYPQRMYAETDTELLTLGS